jgi:hypothetical protein
MFNGLCALAALLLLAWLILRLMRLPPLTDDEVQELVDEYWVCEILDDSQRANEVLRLLQRHGIVVRYTDDGARWERT